MFNRKHKYLITWSFSVGLSVTKGNYGYIGEKIKNLADLTTLEGFIRHDIHVKYPGVSIPNEIIIENVYKL